MTRSGAGSSDDRLSRLLRDRGAVPVPIPLTSTEPVTDLEALIRAARNLSTYDWLVVTSARAVSPLLRAFAGAGVSVGALRASGVRICAVGPRTAEALVDAGMTADLIPERFHAEGVADSILATSDAEGLRVLFPRAEEGRDIIPARLRAAGVSVEVVTAYRTVPVPGAADRLSAMVVAGSVDVLTFTAGSSAHAFADAWSDYCVATAGVGEGESASLPLPEGLAVVALGPATASMLRAKGIAVHRTADPHTLEGLVLALQDWLAHRNNRN